MDSKPSVTAVIRLLKNAGFQCSRYTDSMSQPTSSGATVRELTRDEITVHWQEGDSDFFDRMTKGGHTQVHDVPAHPHAADYARAYAEVLSSRYTVEQRGTYLTVTGREELPARPAGLPRAAAVRRALRESTINSSHCSAVDLSDHTRVAVNNDASLPAVLTVLKEQGWTIGEQGENWQHIYLKITGSAADRPARLRKLRARKAAQTAQEAVSAPESVQEQPEAPQAAPQAAPEPVEAPSAPSARPERHYSATGVAYTVGGRVTYRTPDGLWHHGRIDTIEPDEDGAQQAHLTVDAYQVAPRRRAPKWSANRPGPRRTMAPSSYVVALDDTDLTPEQ